VCNNSCNEITGRLLLDRYHSLRTSLRYGELDGDTAAGVCVIPAIPAPRATPAIYVMRYDNCLFTDRNKL
jgi:hypothetical protein